VDRIIVDILMASVKELAIEEPKLNNALIEVDNGKKWIMNKKSATLVLKMSWYLEKFRNIESGQVPFTYKKCDTSIKLFNIIGIKKEDQ